MFRIASLTEFIILLWHQNGVIVIADWSIWGKLAAIIFFLHCGLQSEDIILRAWMHRLRLHALPVLLQEAGGGLTVSLEHQPRGDWAASQNNKTDI